MRPRTVAENVSFIISLLVILSGVERPKGQKEKIKKKPTKQFRRLYLVKCILCGFPPQLVITFVGENSGKECKSQNEQCKFTVQNADFVVCCPGHGDYEARVTGKSLKASFADRRVRQYCNKTSMAPPVSTTAENIGTVNVNDRNGVSNL
jgi:hypothetical protein